MKKLFIVAILAILVAGPVLGQTNTPTNTPTNTSTPTNTPTRTNTPTSTPTNTPTFAPQFDNVKAYMDTAGGTLTTCASPPCWSKFAKTVGDSKNFYFELISGTATVQLFCFPGPYENFGGSIVTFDNSLTDVSADAALSYSRKRVEGTPVIGTSSVECNYTKVKVTACGSGTCLFAAYR